VMQMTPKGVLDADRTAAPDPASSVCPFHPLWEQSQKGDREVFINMCRIHGLKYRTDTAPPEGPHLEYEG
jgi:hypothetical protein